MLPTPNWLLIPFHDIYCYCSYSLESMLLLFCILKLLLRIPFSPSGMLTILNYGNSFMMNSRILMIASIFLDMSSSFCTTSLFFFSSIYMCSMLADYDANYEPFDYALFLPSSR